MLLFRRICQFKNYGGADDSIDVKNTRWMDLVTECFDLEMLRLSDAATMTHESYISNSKDNNSSSMSNSNSMSMSSNSSISNSNNMSESNSNSSLEIVILKDKWTLADDKKKRVLVNSYRAYLDLGC